MSERHDTVVIGGGQAGLAVSYHLQRHGREHVVLERARVADRWYSQRWDSLHFQFPNWSMKLPGFDYAGSNPDGFAHRGDVAKLIEDYATFIDAPLRCPVDVRELARDDATGRFALDSSAGPIDAARVVVAAGPFQRASIPACASELPAHAMQLHASQYFRPSQLPPGAVLIIGSGSSGAQIAEELLRDGRTVYLSVGRHRRIPRRYRGRDLLAWMYETGMVERSKDPPAGGVHPPTVLLSGSAGGHDMDLRALAADGAVLLGKLEGVRDGAPTFDASVNDTLAFATRAFEDYVRMVDAYIRDHGIDAPEEVPRRLPEVRFDPPRSLDLAAAGINTVLWCTGYRVDFDWIRLPLFDEHGNPKHLRGVTACPGLCFVGLHWMYKYTSATMFGVGEDAAYIADHLQQSA